MAALTTDWREFLSLLISHRVKFVVVGGHAVAVHARARTTELRMNAERSPATKARSEAMEG